MTILLLFFCSGATGLIYEVLWSKYLALLFGSTVQAQTVVLAVFMGGLALGNRWFGRRADHSTRPLALYGVLEVAIGAYAVLFPFIYLVADGVFARVGAGLLHHNGWLLLLKGLLSAALLLGPTVLMGGTLPLLAAWLQQSTSDPGQRSARFYSTNSLGAVCGAGLAGFCLVSWLGLSATLQAAGLANVLIGVTALAIARRCGPTSVAGSTQAPMSAPLAMPAQDQGKPGSVPHLETAPGLLRWGCLLVTLTGAVSMGLEVLASRCLSMIFGASLQAFAIVLMAFILGIGLGSAAIASRPAHGRVSQGITVLLVLAAAAWIGLLVFNIERLAGFYLQARSGLGDTAMGYSFQQVLTGLFSMLLLGLPAAVLGAVLPLWMRAVSGTSRWLGDRVGRLLTWNTLGAVGGALVTGFILMPLLGLRGSFAALALFLSGAALAVGLAARQRLASIGAAALCVLLILVWADGGHQWRRVLSSGVFRYRGADLASAKPRLWSDSSRLVFYEDAPDATVSVEEEQGARGPVLGLRVNGKPDASSQGDLSTQLLLAHLPLMVRPDSRQVFVFGLGSGITAGAVLDYPIERLTVAENCEPVVRAARLFAPWNNGVLTDARTELCREDARTVLKLSRRQYDVIIAEPSNPWMVGVGSVFSRDFYELAAKRLKPDGIMAQWFHVYEMNDGIVGMVVRTFGTVFPVMEIWDAEDGDIIMLGSKQPWKTGPEAFAKAFELAAVKHHLAAIGLTGPETVWARQIASQRTGFAVAGPGPIQTDEFPVLEYAAPKAFFIGHSAQFLHRFDERTWQMDLALAEKSRLLMNMAPAQLEAAFGGQYRSVNPDVQACVSRRVGSPSGRTRARLGGGFSSPCVFEDQKRVSVTAPPRIETDERARQLFEAELALQAEGGNPAQAIERIADLLQKAQPSGSANPVWHADYYACLGAKASLRRGDVVKARELLLAGLRLEPNSDQLHFVARVMAREGMLTASNVELLSDTASLNATRPSQPALTAAFRKIDSVQ
jgi:spermidine synthase